MKFAFRTMLLVALSVGACAFAQSDAGWVTLFDGKDLDGWTKADGSPVKDGWEVADGVIHRTTGHGDLFTKDTYLNFELEFEWKISSGGNSGVKYRFTNYGKQALGPEYQVLDDEKHPDANKGPNGTHRAAALYDLIPANDQKKLNPVGEWNTAKIVANGSHLEHYLNGKLVMQIDLDSQQFKDALAASKFKAHEDYCRLPGRIQLQDHGNEVWFRNIRVKKLD